MYFWGISVLPVSHLQEESVDSVYEEENKDDGETVSSEEPENPGQVEEEKVDDQTGDEDCWCDERQSNPGQEEIFLVKSENIWKYFAVGQARAKL